MTLPCGHCNQLDDRAELAYHLAVYHPDWDPGVMAISVDVGDIEAILTSGEWIRVTGVSVDFAEYSTGVGDRFAHGLHVQATFVGGPNNGDVLVLPLDRIDAVRTS